ncbi:MAG TPA: EF-hand domain-containing protein, partial [Elusimicrobiales bacterium]|nr:EF-hand domain-containing protein [Elusimicrobiales bacterium]
MRNLGTVILLSALCCPAFAEEKPAQAAADKQQEPAVRIYFARMDKNGDQKLQLPEFESEVEAQFMVMDADKDGYVTKAEYVQYFCGKPKVEPKTPNHDKNAALVAERYNLGECVAVRSAKFDTADAKKDGKVNKAEAKATTRMDFKNSDTDKSGTLTITEWEGLFAM